MIDTEVKETVAAGDRVLMRAEFRDYFRCFLPDLTG